MEWESYLISYGPLGAWTMWLVYEKQKLLSKLNGVIRDNTLVLRELCIELKGGSNR